MTRSGLDPESVAVRRHLISALQQEATLIVDQGTYMGDKSEELEDVFGLKLFKFFFFFAYLINLLELFLYWNICQQEKPKTF